MHHAVCTVVSTNYLVTLTVLRSIMLIMYRDHRVGQEVLGGAKEVHAPPFSIFLSSCVVILFYNCDMFSVLPVLQHCGVGELG